MGEHAPLSVVLLSTSLLFPVWSVGFGGSFCFSVLFFGTCKTSEEPQIWGSKWTGTWSWAGIGWVGRGVTEVVLVCLVLGRGTTEPVLEKGLWFWFMWVLHPVRPAGGSTETVYTHSGVSLASSCCSAVIGSCICPSGLQLLVGGAWLSAAQQ